LSFHMSAILGVKLVLVKEYKFDYNKNHEY